MKLICFSLLLFGLTIKGQAQIAAPDFLCVVNDTLFWDAVPENCGPFTAYEVHGSNNIDGPYSLLATISDPAETSFFHASANNQTWFYYLTSPHACPGETVLHSDTLDNLIPLPGPIAYVSVLNGQVEISWSASPSPETIGYVISRNTMSGTTILDTVYGATSYIDATGTPDTQSEVYFVVALDACGNKSLVPDQHQTVLMDFTPPDACNPGLAINWSPYINWSGGVDRYEIFIGVDGAAPSLAGIVGGNQTSFGYGEGNDGEALCFYVEAVEAGTELRSRSNIQCTNISILQPIRRIELLGASVNADGSVDIEWIWDPTALIVDAFQERGAVDDDVIEVLDLNLTNPLTTNNTRTDTDISAQQRAYFYAISGNDECGNFIASNQSTTPFLQGNALTDGNRLSWGPYIHNLATDLTYELVRLGGAGETVVFTGSSSDLQYLDPQNQEPSAEGVCYYLRVNVTYTLASGEELNRIVRSNIVCLVPAPKVFVPNVFAPEGLNTSFRPQLSFGTLATYELDIYDRWGAQVFHSDSIEKSWDGKRQGELMPQGVYLYFIRMTPAGGETIELQGDVLLLR